ncbi:hypothetical protein H4582DRAFT_1894766 [Lactarius indigo]|nr:hypothetical protein H4582DRAFT_1894766 [Lactarius indigo]
MPVCNPEFHLLSMARLLPCIPLCVPLPLALTCGLPSLIRSPQVRLLAFFASKFASSVARTKNCVARWLSILTNFTAGKIYL